jgi:hypothetical protein
LYSAVSLFSSQNGEFVPKAVLSPGRKISFLADSGDQFEDWLGAASSIPTVSTTQPHRSRTYDPWLLFFPQIADFFVFDGISVLVSERRIRAKSRFVSGAENPVPDQWERLDADWRAGSQLEASRSAAG